MDPPKDARDMLGSTLAKMEPQPTKREKLLTKINSVGKNQPSGNSKTLLIDSEKVTRMHNQTHWSFTVDFICHFFTHPNLFKMICGSDMNMILNHFCKFL